MGNKTMIDSIQEMLEASEGWGVTQSPQSKRVVVDFPTPEQADAFATALCRLLTVHHNTRDGYMKFHRTEEERNKTR